MTGEDVGLVLLALAVVAQGLILSQHHRGLLVVCAEIVKLKSRGESQ